MIQCNNCGYPVINGMHTCPNCLAEMPDEIVAPLPVDEDAYEYNEDEIPICSLRPISLPNEREMPEKVYEEGAEVFLSRENTVPHDSSIDDEEQAYLKVLCDEIFVRSNFVNMISVNMKKPMIKLVRNLMLR